MWLVQPFGQPRFFLTLYRSPQNTIAAIKETYLTFKLFALLAQNEL